MITQIFFPPDLAKESGLRGGKLERLGKVVILAGPNGSGKSRYLQFVQDLYGNSINIPGLNQLASHYANQVNTLQSMLKPGMSDAERDQRQRAITGAEYERRKQELLVEACSSMVFSPTRSSALVRLSYPGENKTIADAREMSPSGLKTVADSTSAVGFRNAFNGMHAYCTQIAQGMCNAEHPRMSQLDTVVQQQQDARMFNNILRGLLGGEIGFTVQGTEILPVFRDRLLVVNELSTGERILLAWAISLHRQRQPLSSAILLFDEPESHLHHEACIRALTKLRDEVLGPEGQIWLATHSVPLLAWGGLDSVHFVKDGAIEFAGNKVTAVVESLLGGKEGRDRLKTFLSDADEIAFMEFAVQCVLPAGVADPKTGDKQQAQFIEVLHQRLSTQQKIRILDFSAGKGRFGSALRERLSTHEDTVLQQRIEYHAYNSPQFTPTEVKEACKSRIATLGQPGSVDDYYWDSLSQLQARHGQTIDVVILCNVLHEIRPEEWLTVFRDIEALLAPDGVLVVMEDLFPPVGELPNERGYLLFDEFGLGLLFGDSSGVKVLQKRENRLLAVEVPKRLVSRVTKDTRTGALRAPNKNQV
jgi:predicted ATPase